MSIDQHFVDNVMKKHRNRRHYLAERQGFILMHTYLVDDEDVTITELHSWCEEQFGSILLKQQDPVHRKAMYKYRNNKNLRMKHCGYDLEKTQWVHWQKGNNRCFFISATQKMHCYLN